MTKKLEEEFNLPPIEEVNEVVPSKEETQEIIEETQNALSVSEKINLAFKEIKGLEDHEVEMNDIAKEALNSYKQLMDLGMNVSDMAAGKVFAESRNMLKIALDASDAKTKAKLQQIDLMLKKARIDKFSDKGTSEETVQATVFDRNDLLRIIKGGGGDS